MTKQEVDFVRDLIREGQPKKAYDYLVTVRELYKDDSTYHCNVAICLDEMKLTSQAIETLRATISNFPKHITSKINLADIWFRANNFEEAEDLYQHILSPISTTTMIQEGTLTLQEQIHCLRALGLLLIEQLDIDKALTFLRTAAIISGSSDLYSEYIAYCAHVNYNYAFQKRWCVKFANPLRGELSPDFRPSTTTDFSFKAGDTIGFVGDVFKTCACGRVLLPKFRELVDFGVKIIVFSDTLNIANGDMIAIELRNLVGRSGGKWFSTFNLTDEQLAVCFKFRADEGMNLLVDLQGYKPRSRLLAIARDPVHKVCTWLGYPNNTGITSNAGNTGQWAWDYITGELPEIKAPPQIDNKFITFGSAHRAAKINNQTIMKWRDILARNKNSRIRIIVKGGENNKRARTKLVLSGIKSEAIDLIDRFPTRAEYLDFFNSVDYSLDPVPYPGGATNFDSIAMGREIYKD